MTLDKAARGAWEEYKAQLTVENIKTTRKLLESTLNIPPGDTEEFEKYVDYDG